ncbi:MAG TPA: right-handed parallel beta-helix repeat-containing protein [Streptosporangiaceae bacterium]
MVTAGSYRNFGQQFSGGKARWARVAVAGCAALAAAASTAAPASAAGPTAAARTLAVRTLRDAGPGSLRAAITAANLGGPHSATRVVFSVRGTIRLARALPAIHRRVTIDATSAPGYHGGGPPVVAINCHRHLGLVFGPGAGGSSLLGLAVDRASDAGVTLVARHITLNHDYIGLNLRGHPAGNLGNGVLVASNGNRIGLNPAKAVNVVANVISANAGAGIVLAGSAHNTVVSNRIGTNRAGTRALGNRGDGIVLTGGAADNEIGGTAYVNPATGQANDPTGDKGTEQPVFVVPPLGNTISGNKGNGVLINAFARDNRLNGNFIGTTGHGDRALGNAKNGVRIYHAGPGNSLTGCKFVNNPFVYYNVISGNGRNGLYVTGSNNVTVQGNFFGIAANNADPLGNRGDGILVGGSSANTQVGGVIPLGNVSAGNGRNGIEVNGTAHGFVTFNTFGGLAAFGGAVPNGHDGVLITSTGGDNLVRTNVMSGNTGNGIELAGNASGVTVDPDISGLNTKGNGLLPNGGDGVLIDGSAHGNTIGGTLRSVIPQNTFSGNQGYGLAITGHAYHNLVTHSAIGTDTIATGALGNQAGGVLLAGTAFDNAIGAPRLHPANLISGNTGIGVTLLSHTRDNWVINNWIGLGRFGHSLPNTGRPVLNLGRHNHILGNRTMPLPHQSARL